MLGTSRCPYRISHRGRVSGSRVRGTSMSSLNPKSIVAIMSKFKYQSLGQVTVRMFCLKSEAKVKS